jgi:2-aminoadipate transaminase
MKSSTIRELLKLTEQPDIISFAGGLPAPESFPVEAFKEACNRVLCDRPAVALQYGTTEGYQMLRQWVADRHSKNGLKLTADNVLITTGSQQALDLLGKVFINSGDNILVESPTYMGATQAWSVYGAEYVPVPSDENGIITDGVEAALRAAPKFMYILPNFQNPTGVTIPVERRKELVELADRYGVPIVEDDPYGELCFEGSKLPSVQSLDSQFRGEGSPYNGNVIYLGTFSKTLAPGIRLAWTIAAPQVIAKMALAKQSVDLNTAVFTQAVAYEVARGAIYDQHIQEICDLYRERRTVMLDTLEEHMPAGVHWTHPRGGLFLWVTLPNGMNTVELFTKAIEKKVAYVPGVSFFPCGGGENTMRLNFSYSGPDLINEGISRLAQTVREAFV